VILVPLYFDFDIFTDLATGEGSREWCLIGEYILGRIAIPSPQNCIAVGGAGGCLQDFNGAPDANIFQWRFAEVADLGAIDVALQLGFP